MEKGDKTKRDLERDGNEMTCLKKNKGKAKDPVGKKRDKGVLGSAGCSQDNRDPPRKGTTTSEQHRKKTVAGITNN